MDAPMITYSGQAQIEREHAARLQACADALEMQLPAYSPKDPQRVRAETAIAQWRTEAAAKLKAVSLFLGYTLTRP